MALVNAEIVFVFLLICLKLVMDLFISEKFLEIIGMAWIREKENADVPVGGVIQDVDI